MEAKNVIQRPKRKLLIEPPWYQFIPFQVLFIAYTLCRLARNVVPRNPGAMKGGQSAATASKAKSFAVIEMIDQ